MSASVFPVPFSGIQETLIDAKGDLIVGNAADTPIRLAVGSNNQVLTADSSVTGGVKWATPGTPNFVGCSIYASSSSQSFTSGVTSILTYPSEDFDTDGFHSTSTNTSRITIPSGKAGKYLFNVVIAPGDTTPEYAILSLRKNNSGVVISAELKRDRNIGSNTWSLNGSMVYDAAVGDYFEVALECNWTTGSKTINSRFTATYLGA